MFRLGPKLSNLNSFVYRLENSIPHLVRTQEFIDELMSHAEPAGGCMKPPSNIQTLELNNVTFEYDSSETVLNEL